MSSTDSPCIEYCIYNYEEDFCEGCGRNLLEISDWSRLSKGEKALVMETSKKRLRIVERSKEEEK
jgi:predicted Fe-S protein YdhL (DUF1289 family)